MLMPNSFEGIYVIHKYDFLIVVNGTINEFIKKEMALSIFVLVSINYGQRPLPYPPSCVKSRRKMIQNDSSRITLAFLIVWISGNNNVYTFFLIQVSSLFTAAPMEISNLISQI